MHREPRGRNVPLVPRVSRDRTSPKTSDDCRTQPPYDTLFVVKADLHGTILSYATSSINNLYLSTI